MANNVIRAFGPIVALAYCNSCERIEFMRAAGPFFFQCEECMSLVPKELK